jgi:hypothetical protein
MNNKHITSAFNQQSDFNTVFDAWFQTFDELALNVYNKHKAVKNGPKELAHNRQETFQAWCEAEEKIQKHFFARYKNTTQFWSDYFKSLDKEFPVVNNFQNNAESSQSYYMQLVSPSEKNAQTCKNLDLLHLNYMVHSHLSEILFERGYTQNAKPQGGRVHAKFSSKPPFTL